MKWHIFDPNETPAQILDEESLFVARAAPQHARLIAAAPELLEALEIARQLILDEWGAGTYCKGTRVEEEFGQIEAAIRKAKGE